MTGTLLLAIANVVAMLRRMLVVVLSIVLVFSLLGANAVWAIDRGPFNSDRVIDSAEESGIYDEIQDEVIEQIGEEDITFPYPGIEERADEILALIVTADWIQGETERNVKNLYAHLEDGEPLELYVDLASHKAHIETTFASEFGLADLEIDRLDRLMAGEESYRTERDELRTELLAAIGVDPADGFGVPTIQGLLESPEQYDETRADHRATIVDETMETLEADAGFGNDRLAGMYDDPGTYEQEQETFREQEKERIQEETDEELSDEELEAIYADEQDQIVDEAAKAAGDRIEFEDGPETAEERTEELATLKAEGLATNMTYAVFTDRYDGIVADIEDDVLADIEENPERYEDDIDAHVQEELADTEVPAAVEEEVQEVAAVTVTAITTEMTYAEYLDAYDAAVAEVEAAAVADITENRDQYEEELEDAGLANGEFDDVPSSIEPETDAVVDLVIEAVLTEMAYDAFMETLSEREQALAFALAGGLFEEGMLPERFELTDQVASEAGEELELIGDIMAILTPVGIGLSVLVLALVGGIFAVTQNVATTAIASGTSALAVGVPSIAVASLVPDILDDALADADLPTGLHESLVELIGLILFAPFQQQGLALIGIGTILVGLGIAIRAELITIPGTEAVDD